MKTSEELLLDLIKSNTPFNMGCVGRTFTDPDSVGYDFFETVLYVGGYATDLYHNDTVGDVVDITGIPREHVEFSYDMMQPFIRESKLPENFVKVLKAYEQLDPSDDVGRFRSYLTNHQNTSQRQTC